MIDFRYHIVSLISVFLALAVGIALGAGPLKETIGDTLTGQVEVLRGEREALRAELTDAQTSLDRQSVFLEESAPRLLAGTLTDRRVAVVSLGEVDADAREGVEEQLTTAGATISARVQVTDRWADPTTESFRDELGTNVRPYLDPALDAGDDTDVELAEALAQGLTGADPAAPDTLSEPAGLLLQMLATGDTELVTVAEQVTTPADAVVVLVAEPDEPAVAATPAPEEDAEDVVTAQVALVAALQDRSEGALLAGGVATAGDLVSTVLADSDLAARIATVTGVRGITGQISVPLGLNARIGGTVGHYGFGDGLTPVPDPVTLPAVDRTPEPADGAATDAADAADTADPAETVDPADPGTEG